MKKYLLPGLAGLCLIAAATLAITFHPRAETVMYDVNRTTPVGYGYRSYNTQRSGWMMQGFQSRRNTPIVTIDTDLTGSDYDSTSLKAVLDTVLADERNALAEYNALVDAFGNTYPWTRLIQAETRHIFELERIYTAFNFEIPADTSLAPASVPSSLDEAYRIGIEAETYNISLYENYLDTNLPDSVEQIFTNLMNASYKHLDTFTAYANGTVPVNGCITDQRIRQRNGRWN